MPNFPKASSYDQGRQRSPSLAGQACVESLPLGSTAVKFPTLCNRHVQNMKSFLELKDSFQRSNYVKLLVTLKT